MKILVVCQYYYPEQFRITDICEELVNIGHQVTVMTGLPNYPEGKVLKDYKFGKKRAEIINGVKIIRSFEIGRGNNKLQLFLNYFSFPFSASIKMLLMKEKFDVILVNQLSPILMVIPAIIYKIKNCKKILLYCLDLWPASLVAGGIKEKSFIYHFFYLVSKWIYNSVDSIFVTSNLFKDYLQDTIKVKVKKIAYLPQYAEEIFMNSPFISADDKKFNFVFAGNIGEMQSVETIIYAANELQKNLSVVFHIVGDGSKLESCKSLANSLNLKNVIFYGRRPIQEMNYYYGLADAMLVTLKKDKFISYTLPGKVQSYMAAGKPIIAAIDGETKKIIDEAGCGFCCNAENSMELASIIQKFINLENKAMYEKKSKNYYVENFSKEHFINLLNNELLLLGGNHNVQK